jgi:ankyrin repeat protein
MHSVLAILPTFHRTVKRSVMKPMKLALMVTLLLVGVSTTFSQELFDALKNNDLPKVKTLLENNHQLLNSRDESGNTPLHLAVRQKQHETVAYLLNEGADVNCGNTNRVTPLHISSSVGNPEITWLLIEKDADVGLADYQLHTPLHYAVANGFSEVAEMLVMSGAPLEAKNSYDRTPLLLCARERGTPEIARLLIDAGADVNVKDRFESTPLELAAWRGYKEIIGLLIENGAEIPVTGRKARTILFLACQQGLSDLFRLQVEKGIDVTIPNSSQGTLMHDAAKGGSPEIIDALIKKGLNVATKDKYGWTPLHYAAMNNHINVLQTLMDNSADLNARNMMGQTAYNVADEFGREQAKEFLVKNGADQNPMLFPVIEGQYLGQTPPDDTPVIFAPGIISSIWGLHSSPAFSPDGAEVYWSPLIELPGQPYSRTHIHLMKRVGDRWTPPQIAPFSGLEGITDGEPFFSQDGNRIYFNSTRPNPAQDNRRKENIWYVDRTQSGWSDPKPLSQSINLMSMHWQFSIDKKGNIYFASDNAGGFGMQDIYCSALKDGDYEKPENLGLNVNTADNEMTPFISPDGDYLIYCRGKELRISFRDKDGTWSESKSMGSRVNTGHELCPLVTPDNKYLFFLSGREGESHPFWVSARVIEELRPDL